MTQNINTFRSGFRGIRPNRFKINGRFPTRRAGSNANNQALGQALGALGGASALTGQALQNQSVYDFAIYCKATQLPGSSIGLIPVAWQGRVVKFSGERVYQDWSIQVYDSSLGSNDLRGEFENWIEEMNTRSAHTINYNLTSNWTVEYDDITTGTQSDGHTTSSTGQQNHKKHVTLVNCFPIDLSPVDLSYDLTDTFSEFTVTLAYDYWYEGTPGTSSSAPASQR